LRRVAEAAVSGGLGSFDPGKHGVWAFATSGHAAPVLLDAIATEAVPRLREFNAQNLANMSWAFATAPAALRRRCSTGDRHGGGARRPARLQAAGARQHGVGLCQG
jgi:hypothetical protein